MIGPVAHYVNSLENSNQRTKYLWNLIDGSLENVLPTSLWLYIDVRDLALAHISVIEKQEAGGQQILVAGGSYSYPKVVNTLREQIPGIKDRVPEGNPDDGFPEGGVYWVDTSKSAKSWGSSIHHWRW